MRVTERQLKILKLVQAGLTYKEVALNMGTTRKNVISILYEFGKDNGFGYSWFVARLNQYDLSSFKPRRDRNVHGICFHKPTGKFQARRTINGVRHNFGLFKLRGDAIKAMNATPE